MNMIESHLSRSSAQCYRKPLCRAVSVSHEASILQTSLMAGREQIGELTETPAWDDLSEE